MSFALFVILAFVVFVAVWFAVEITRDISRIKTINKEHEKKKADLLLEIEELKKVEKRNE